MPNDGTPSAATGTPAPAPVTAPIAAPTIQPTSAPAAAIASPAPSTSAPATTAPPELDPNWLADRIERAKKSGAAELLKQLGTSDLAAAKAAVSAAQAAEELKKTADQRAAEASTRATQAEQDAARANALIKEQAARMLMVLTPEQQKSVTDFAGDNPAEQLRYIQHAAPLWAKPAAAVTASTTEAKPAAQVAATPTNTAPPPGAPPGTAPASPPDHRAVYMQLQQSNPFAAAAYGIANFSAVHLPKQ